MTNILQKELKWHGSPVTTYSGTISEVLTHIPEFDRRPFSASNHKDSANQNSVLDMIIRRPILEYDSEIPVATVSKSYQLIQHRQVIKAIVDALAQVGINHNEVKAELMMSQYGERVGLHIQFPDAYSFDRKGPAQPSATLSVLMIQ